MSKTLDRLSKILALADDGATEGERDAALAKATEIAAAVGIELAIARAHRADKEKRETPEKRAFKVGDYRAKTNKHMIELFCAIAEPHDVMVTVGGSNVYTFGHGFPSDLDLVEQLFSMAAVHMVTTANEMLKRGAQREERWQVDGRIWRAQFYEGFRSRLLSRLWEARSKARAHAEETEGSTGVAVVLRGKSADVKDFYEEETKHLRPGSCWEGPTSYGWVDGAQQAGRDSASRMSLEPEGGVGAGKVKRSLPE